MIGLATSHRQRTWECERILLHELAHIVTAVPKATPIDLVRD